MLRKATPYIYILFFFIAVNVVFSQEKSLQIIINQTEITTLNTPKEESFNAIDPNSVSQILKSYKMRLARKGYLSPVTDSVISRDSLIIAYIYPGEKVEMINIDFSELSKSVIQEKKNKTVYQGLQ